MTKPDFLVALMFTHQLGSRTARTDLARTDLEIRQLESQTQRIRLDLNAAVVNLLIQIRELENVMELNRQEIMSAREKTALARAIKAKGSRQERDFALRSGSHTRFEQTLEDLASGKIAPRYVRMPLLFPGG